RNTVVKLDKTPERKGYTFTGWYADRKLTDKISSIQMTSDKTVYAGWRHDYTPADLNSKDHVSYVSGYPDGTVRPDAPITRAETATMIYRLLTDARRAEIDTEVNSFGDVSSSDWFVRPVSTMANGGYIVGYPDGTFGGSKQITRAEFVTMLVRFIGLKDAECSFHDVSQNHWAYRFIAMATDAGWIAGYTDGTFAPDQTITRAEAMTILNSVLNRGVNEKSELLNFKVWPDNPQTAWYYYEVIEASNGHEYTGARPSEDWTKLVKDLL
ncbi:MAG: S-layer homology domain-containing protein, partial [Oscillospiraceae bacterium]|nr:S-layer homology domain-containing protein [Oscillospiraceae bacterium]